MVHGVSLLRYPAGRKIYATSFFERMNMAYLDGTTKYIYSPDSNALMKFDLNNDPRETSAIELSDDEREAIARKLEAFHANTKLNFEKDMKPFDPQTVEVAEK